MGEMTIVRSGYPSGMNMPMEDGQKIFIALIIVTLVLVAWAYWKD